jgi:hypothetical protein
LDPKHKVMVSGPLAELWNDQGPVRAERVRYIDRDVVRELIRSGVRTFVVAEVGARLLWKTGDEAILFWQSQREHVASPEHGHSPDGFASGYFWLVSEWRGSQGQILVFEKYH